MRYYIIRIQVDFKEPHEMPPLAKSNKKWNSIGYFQNFLCTEKSKESAKILVHDYFSKHETDPQECTYKVDHSVWLRGITKIEQLVSSGIKLTDEMFSKRDNKGIWYVGEKEHYVSEYDAAASLCEDMNIEDL